MLKAIASLMTCQKGIATAFLPIQTSAQVTGSGNSVVITMAPTVVNNLVVVHLLVLDTTITVSSITDDKGNVYIAPVSISGGGTIKCFQSYGVQTTGGATSITIALSATATYFSGADEFSGGKTTNATVNIGGSTIDTGSSASIKVFAFGLTGQLMVATAGTDSARTFTEGVRSIGERGTPYVLYNGVNPAQLRSEYELLISNTSKAPMTIDTSARWVEIATPFFPL